MIRKIFPRQNVAFGVNTRKDLIVAQQESMKYASPKIEKNTLSLKNGEMTTFESTYSDPNNIRIVKIIENNILATDYSVKYLSDTLTQIIAHKDINGIIQIFIPENMNDCELTRIQDYSSGIFKIPISLSKDRDDLCISSFVVDGEEKISSNIKWEIMNLYFMVEDKICKFDYNELFNKLFSNLDGWVSYINPNYMLYNTELIQQFIWPKGKKWTIKVSGNDNFDINSENLEICNVEDFSTSQIIEWNVQGIWESEWVVIDGVKTENIIKGEWQDVVSQLLPFECFQNGIVYSKDTIFSFCLKQNNIEYIFKSI